MQGKLYAILATLLIVLGVVGLFASVNAPVKAAEPEWGKLSFTHAYAATSTADQTLLAAPGANYSWMVTGVWYSTSIVEAGATVRIEDLAGTPIVGISIPTAIANEGMILLGDGVMFSTNSGVQCDFSGSTASVAFGLNAYKVYNP